MTNALRFQTAVTANYAIYFNQQWVGEHPSEWFRERGRLATAVVEEMRAAGVYVFAGGLEEDHEAAFSADPDGTMRPGPHVHTDEFIVGLTIVNVPDDQAAQMWARKIAAACGWPQELRRAYQSSQQGTEVPADPEPPGAAVTDAPTRW